MSKEKKPKFRISLAVSITIAIIMGFVAGVVGELWINSFLAPDVQFKDYRDLTKRLDDLTQQQQKELKDLLSEKDFSVNKVIERVEPTVVAFYPFKSSAAAVSNVYLDNELLGTGFVLTSDGWLVTSTQVISNLDIKYAVQVNDAILPVDKLVSDPLTDVVFVKVAANNLPVVDLGAKNELHTSQSVLVATNNEGFVRTTIDDLYQASATTTSELIQTTEAYYRFILINGTFAPHSVGSAVFNLDGKVIGVLATADGLVIPVDYFSPVIKSAVQDNAPRRVSAGISYLDLEQAINYNSPHQQGALIQQLATTSDLRLGDIIIRVENDEVSRSQSLTQLLQEYHPGDQVSLTVIRDNSEQQVKISLTEL